MTHLTRMTDLVLFAAGSPLIVDYEESARRAGRPIAFAVRNVDGPTFSSDAVRLLDLTALPGNLSTCSYLVPLFTPGHRQRAAREAEGLGFAGAATLVDPTAILPARAELGRGTYINAGCSLGGALRLGAFVLINRAAGIGHHADLGDFVSIGPGAVLAGQVSVGAGSVVGAGAVVLPGIVIGRNAVIGAGAVVTRDVADETTVVGNPARVVGTGGGHKGLRVD